MSFHELEVLEVSEIGVHLVKAKYEKLAMNIDGPMKMNLIPLTLWILKVRWAR